MNQLIGYLFVSMLSVSVPIDGQTEHESKFLEVLKDNKNQIDYLLNVQFKDRFDANMFLFIKDWVWLLDLPSKTIDENNKTDVEFNLNVNSSESTDSEEFFSEHFATGFSIVDWKGTDPKIIVGLTKDYQTLKYIHLLNEKRKADKPLDLYGYLVEKGAIKPVVNSSTSFKGIKTLKTGFNDFKPQVSFVKYSETGGNLIVFIETNALNGKYQSKVQAYSTLLEKGLTKVATNDTRIPVSIVSAAENYYIRGVADIQLKDTNENIRNGSLLVIELCSTQDIPCTGQISYQYCFVEDNDVTPIAEEKPCHKSKLRSLFDANPQNETVSAKPLIPDYSKHNPIDKTIGSEATSSSTESIVNLKPKMTSSAHKHESTSNLKHKSSSNLKPEPIHIPKPELRADLKSGTSSSTVKPISTPNLKTESSSDHKPEPTNYFELESKAGLNADEDTTLESETTVTTKHQPIVSDVKSGSNSGPNNSLCLLIIILLTMI